MKLESFYNVHTVEDMKKRLSLMHSVYEDRQISSDNMFKIDGTEYNNLRYVMSSSKNGYIQSHYFTYTNEATGLVGVCELPSCKKSLIKWCEPKYNNLMSVHTNLWLCLREDLMYDALQGKNVVLSEIQSYDVLALGESLQFLQLEHHGKTSLICLDMWDNINGVHCVKSMEDFDNWFRKIVSKRGYEGKLDNLYVSQLFEVYYEVINSIFMVSDFAPLG